MKDIMSKILIYQQITDSVYRFPMVTKNQRPFITNLADQLQQGIQFIRSGSQYLFQL
ncbi:hypothetical protein D3C87_1720320 [compost metagenome]